MKNILVTFDFWKEGQDILEKELGPWPEFLIF